LISSPINTLFTTRTQWHTRPGFFMVSVLMHGLVVLAAFTLIHTPRVEPSPVPRRYTSLIVKLQRDEPKVEWSSGGGAAPSTPQADTHATRPSEPMAAAAATPQSPAAAALPQSPAYRTSAPITLIEPDIPPNVLPPIKAPIPTVVLWTPHDLPVEKIVPPPPQQQTAASVRPSLSMPNHELHVAEIKLASSPVSVETIPMLAGTTTPVLVHGLDPSQVPQSSSNSPAQPAAKAVLSVSDVMLSKGTISLPPANQSAAASNSDAAGPGQPKSVSAVGGGSASAAGSGSASAAHGGSVISNRDGSGSNHSSGDHGNSNQTATGVGQDKGTKAGPGSGSASGSDPVLASGNGSSLARITRPRDGHFGVIVVGDSVADEYPEVAAIWADRLAYTVYLPVGEAKNWILQYCLPRAAQAAANTTRPDAPWPYLMVTPHLAPGDYDTDALLVHGFINTAGHFEQLAVVFPAQFAQSKFVLAALQQWQFRPAAQNGQLTAVEVLLIIPEENE